MSKEQLDSLFDKSVLYRTLQLSWPAPSLATSAVRESNAPDPGSFTERHIQCVWYDQQLRPQILATNTGEPVKVIAPGRWNLEAGPDFLDAALSIGSSAAVLRGDIELHTNPKDWDRHGHGNDPAYAHVIAHVCCGKGAPPQSLPPGAVQIDLGEAIRANGHLHLEDIDVSAYPYSLSHSGQNACSQAFPSLPLESQLHILESAGQERLRLKSHRMVRLLSDRPADQVLYEEIMAALGYKQNRAPFRDIATAAPIGELRAITENDPITAYSILMGLAGLLPHSVDDSVDEECRSFIRELWDNWYRYQSTYADRLSATPEWKLSSLRPQNHPARRLAAAASLFCSQQPLLDQMESSNIADFAALLSGADAVPYWSDRLSLTGKKQDRTASLLGSDRIAAIITNILIPFLAASGGDPADCLKSLPPQDFNATTREMMSLLMGGDYNQTKYRSGAVQQGLIQIFSDHCMNTQYPCSECKFAQALTKLSFALDQDIG